MKASVYKAYEKVYLHESISHDLGFNVWQGHTFFVIVVFCLFLQWLIEAEF